MFLTRADVVLRAHEVGQGLTDRERIALGATLIQTVLSPRHFPEVAYAAAQLHEHAEALRDAHLDLGFPDGPHMGQDTTHEQTGSSGFCGDTLPQASGPRAPSSSRGRAAWDRLTAAERRISDSWIGDGIAGIGLIVILLGALFAPLILPY